LAKIFSQLSVRSNVVIPNYYAHIQEDHQMSLSNCQNCKIYYSFQRLIWDRLAHLESSNQQYH
ncbi:hypothetical protein, partial [Zunongwangia profunda]|uniref:hypothetical protein n=1 Tax=Zunongwangia profunda TaxID=398743 RepID=UPI00248ED38C